MVASIYTSNAFEKYLRCEGIRHEKTNPKTPQQNGVAERLNRTLVESARSMLLNANLSKQYWAEAVSMAVYLRNRCPIKAVEGKTPYEAWYGQKPKVDHLIVFGCDAFAHIPKDERGKWEIRYENQEMHTTWLWKRNKSVETVRHRKYCTVVMCSLMKRPRNAGYLLMSTNSFSNSKVIRLAKRAMITNIPKMRLKLSKCHQNVMPIRRSTRLRKQPDYFDIPVCHLTETPTTFKQASSSQDKKKWKAAMETEMNSLQENDVWDLVRLYQLVENLSEANGSSRRRLGLTAQLSAIKRD